MPPEMTENSLLKLAGGMAVGTTALMFASSALKKSLKLGKWTGLEHGDEIYGISIIYVYTDYNVLY